ncbi:MAG: AAA family ATPase [Anaerolineae bacterium]|nr:AAA family ATPase [Anaerolineae bacterium]
MGTNKWELSAERLRRRTDPAIFSFHSTEELPPLQKIIGQERAVRAIDFGINITSDGYNIFAVGRPGSGRTTVVRQFLTRQAEKRPVPPEWCYVYNFEDPRRPKALSFPAGRATRFRKGMKELIQQLRQELPRAFEGEHYEQRRREIMLEIQQKQQELFRNLEQYLNERGFALLRTQMGLTIAPMLNGEILSSEAYQKLDPEIRKRFEDRRPELQEQFDKTMRQARELDRQARQAMENLNNELAGFVVDHLMADLREEFADCPKAIEYLDAVRGDVLQNLQNFLSGTEGESSPLPFIPRVREQWFERYTINVLAENSGPHAPVIIEDNPTYHNLIGRIEHRAELGTMVTDFTQIRAGALHRANGGYLVVEAKDLLLNPLAWMGLKRALRSHQIKIEEMTQYYGLLATTTLEPEPIPLDVKVVIIGDELVYQLLYIHDEDFRELFKVKAQFAVDLPRDEAADDYARFIGDLCRREGLRHFDPTAVARLIDEAARLADSQKKVTTHFADVADLVREASFWAERNGRELVTEEDVRAAVQERTYRLNYAAERYVETVQDGVILIDTEGAVVGQVNGISVIELGNFEFGLPSRITARTYVGRAGVVSIEREVKMSGPIHDKGQLILASYLASRFAQKHPLTMSASLTFEQLYSGVEGDSASSTELYALISSLAEVPIKQNLAVTGSVNQFGQIQAIGGVNAKIEGFFDVCKARGLTGDQGVLIPVANIQHLMLRDDVVEAVREGKFHIYAISRVEEGIELLTGMPAGEPDEEGNYPEGTVYARVQAKLQEYAERMKKEEGGAEEEERDNPGDEEPSPEEDEPEPPTEGK